MTPDHVLSYIASQEKVALRESSIAEGLDLPGDPESMAALGRALDVLRDAGDICRWTTKGKPVVTLSSVAAYRFRLKLNQSSTKWMDYGTPDRPDRNDKLSVRRIADGRRVISEADLGDGAPGDLDQLVDGRGAVEDDPEFGRARAIGEERMLGLLRPTLVLVGCKPWTAENWERAPDAHVCDPLDDPRRVPAPGEAPRRRMTASRLRKLRSGDPCPVCGGREMRFMIGLVTRKAGKNRAARPPEMVEGVEYCARCHGHPQDGMWPRVFAINDSEIGKVAQ